MCHVILEINIGAAGKQVMDKLWRGGPRSNHQWRETLDTNDSQNIIIILPQSIQTTGLGAATKSGTCCTP